MQSYLMLGRFTEQGANNIQQSPQRLQQFKEICQSEGAKLISYHLLMGKYDVAALIESENPEGIAKIALIIGKRGNMRTETLTAFNEKQAANIIGTIK